MNMDELARVAKAMVAKGKGILAADESSGTIKKRFDAIGVDSTEAARRDYREMLFRTAEAMKNHISGVILYDETIRQKAKDGTPLVQADRAGGLASRHQGRQGHQAPSLLSRRSHHRRSRRIGRAPASNIATWARASRSGAR